MTCRTGFRNGGTYSGVTYPKVFGCRIVRRLWARLLCPRGMHILDEVLAADDHCLVCDACGFEIAVGEGRAAPEGRPRRAPAGRRLFRPPSPEGRYATRRSVIESLVRGAVPTASVALLPPGPPERAAMDELERGSRSVTVAPAPVGAFLVVARAAGPVAVVWPLPTYPEEDAALAGKLAAGLLALAAGCPSPPPGGSGEEKE